MGQNETDKNQAVDLGIAAPLTKYLTSAGTYEGFDIIEDHINWCKEKITMKFPNFNFKLVDLHNENYNPSGTFRATDFRFPYDDGYFGHA